MKESVTSKKTYVLYRLEWKTKLTQSLPASCSQCSGFPDGGTFGKIPLRGRFYPRWAPPVLSHRAKDGSLKGNGRDLTLTRWPKAVSRLLIWQ